jgi:inner membrane protein involved in colicin E2 resistance
MLLASGVANDACVTAHENTSEILGKFASIRSNICWWDWRWQYLAGALHERRLAAQFAAGIATLYAVLFGVLLSEDNALLMWVCIGVTLLRQEKFSVRLGM